MPCRAGAAFAFDRLIVDADASEALFDAVLDEATDRHNPSVSRVPIEDDWELHRPGNPAPDHDTLGEGRCPNVFHPRVGPDDATGPDKPCLGAGGFHDLCEGGTGGMHDGEDTVLSLEEGLEACGRVTVRHKGMLLMNRGQRRGLPSGTGDAAYTRTIAQGRRGCTTDAPATKPPLPPVEQRHAQIRLPDGHRSSRPPLPSQAAYHRRERRAPEGGEKSSRGPSERCVTSPSGAQGSWTRWVHVRRRTCATQAHGSVVHAATPVHAGITPPYRVPFLPGVSPYGGSAVDVGHVVAHVPHDRMLSRCSEALSRLLPQQARHPSPPDSSRSPAGTPPFPQRVWITPCQQHTRGWRHGRGGGVPGPRQGSALAGAASLRQRAATARPGPLGTGAAHAAASAPPAPRQTGSRASVVRPRSPCHD